MSKPYDATTKRLLELRPADWVTFLGLPPGPTTLMDADLSTISSAADRLVRVEGATPYILHNEFESGRDTGHVPFRLLQYNVNAEAKHRIPVVSTVFLLHRGADSPRITGQLERLGPENEVYHSFRYRAIRIWQEDVERLLTGGLSLLPFAPIAQTTPDQLPAIRDRMEARIDAEARDDTEAGDLWTATYVLMGLRYNNELNTQLLQGVRRMKESVTYQAILEEGRIAGEQKGLIEGERKGLVVGERKGRVEGRVEGEYRAILRVGTKRFGVPSAATDVLLRAIDSLDRLETLLDRITEVESWEELLADA